MSAVTVTAVELAFVEGTSDKTYRVFTIGTMVTCQYGRTGTYGTFTPRKGHDTPEKAAAAAQRTITGKLAKGYRQTRATRFTADCAPTDGELDTAVNLAPAGPDCGVVTVEARAQSDLVTGVNGTATGVDPAILGQVLAALGALDITGPAKTIPGDVTHVRPMLATTAAPHDIPTMLTNPTWVAQPKCIAPMTQVLTDTGWVKARYVTPGCSVMSSDGRFHEVQSVHRSARNRRPMLTIQPWGTQPITLTADHRLLTADGWKEARELTLQDRLILPRPVLDRSPMQASLVLDAGAGYTKTVDVDADMAWFCGLWMGDGSAQSHYNGKTTGRISLAVNRRDQFIVDRLTKLIKEKFGSKPNVHSLTKSSMDQVYFTDLPLTKWLTRNFRHIESDGIHFDASSAGKSLPAWIDAWPDWMFDSFLEGYLAADGCSTKDVRQAGRGNPQVIVSTTSSHIAGLLYRQLLRAVQPPASTHDLPPGRTRTRTGTETPGISTYCEAPG